MRGTVLIVEKDLQTRQTIIYMIEALNYRAVGCPNMPRALNAIKALHFDAMIVSPGSMTMGEPSYAIEAKKLQPCIKFIVAAGVLDPRYLMPPVDAFVEKPFSLQTIDEMLDKLTSQS